MSIRKLAASSIIIILILFSYTLAFSGNTEATPEEKQEYERDYNRVADLRASLEQSDARDMDAYEALADDIDQKWRGRHKEYQARLMLEICRPLSSGIFREDRQYELAREYALSALDEPDNIPLILELELMGHVITFIIGRGAPSGDDFAEKRSKDTGARLHAWKRLLEAIDPNRDPDEVIWGGNVPPPAATGLSPGVDPAAIQDAELRTEYEKAIRINKQKVQKRHEQNQYHKWLKRFPTRSESYIIRAYSHPPYATEELRNMLDNQLPDQEAKARIIEAVEKNIQESQEGMR
ncbi:MAG: hypothetical protein GY839_18780 [candidate division Zixibacteria bacterium]|nr:hypothetical protein [candidate division Zixibacteria bacterium]